MRGLRHGADGPRDHALAQMSNVQGADAAGGGGARRRATVSSHLEGHARATEEVQAERLADVHNRVEKRFVSLVLLHLPGRELAHGQLIAPRQHLTP